jgi:hypothetical protein
MKLSSKFNIKNWLGLTFVVFILTILTLNLIKIPVDAPRPQNSINSKVSLNLNQDNQSQETVTGNYENNFNHNFFQKNRLTYLLKSTQINLLQTYGDSRIIQGKDGWLEYSDEYVSSYDQDGLRPDQIQNWYDNILIRQNYYKSQGIEYITVIAPKKSSLLLEQFPNHADSGSIICQFVGLSSSPLIQ